MICVARFVGQAGAAVVVTGEEAAAVPASRQAVVEAEKKVVDNVGLMPVEVMLATSAPKETKTPAFTSISAETGMQLFADENCSERMISGMLMKAPASAEALSAGVVN
jgi:hypothetical protein